MLGIASGCGDDTRSATATVATFNLGLAAGFVAFSVERTPANVSAIAASDFDVMCLQEVWQTDDVQALIGAQGSPYTSSFWVDSSEQAGPPACTQEDVTDLLTCATTNGCDDAASGLAACVIANCGTQVGALDASNPECLTCLTSQLGTADANIPAIQQACVVEGSFRFTSEGRNGLLLLSAHPLTGTEALKLDSFLTRRYVLHAQVDLPGPGPTDVFCTHLTTEQPINYGGSSDSWTDENADQIARILTWIDSQATTQRVILMGDFNTGPPIATLAGVDSDNYAQLPAGGFANPYIEQQSDPACTFCESNTLIADTGGRVGVIIDHVLLRGLAGATLSAERTFDGLVEIETAEGAAQSHLSDHFGVSVSLTQ